MLFVVIKWIISKIKNTCKVYIRYNKNNTDGRGKRGYLNSSTMREDSWHNRVFIMNENIIFTKVDNEVSRKLFSFVLHTSF